MPESLNIPNLKKELSDIMLPLMKVYIKISEVFRKYNLGHLNYHLDFDDQGREAKLVPEDNLTQLVFWALESKKEES